jgi:hypothetical protein
VNSGVHWYRKFAVRFQDGRERRFGFFKERWVAFVVKKQVACITMTPVDPNGKEPSTSDSNFSGSAHVLSGCFYSDDINSVGHLIRFADIEVLINHCQSLCFRAFGVILQNGK